MTDLTKRIAEAIEKKAAEFAKGLKPPRMQDWYFEERVQDLRAGFSAGAQWGIKLGIALGKLDERFECGGAVVRIEKLTAELEALLQDGE